MNVQRAEVGGEAGLTESDVAKFRALPLDHQARISAMPVAARASAIRTFPSAEQDRKFRDARKAERAKVAEQTRRNRLELCRRTLAGEYGPKARSRGFAILTNHGGDARSYDVEQLSPKTVLALVEVAIRAQRFVKRGGKKR